MKVKRFPKLGAIGNLAAAVAIVVSLSVIGLVVAGIPGAAGGQGQSGKGHTSAAAGHQAAVMLASLNLFPLMRLDEVCRNCGEVESVKAVEMPGGFRSVAVAEGGYVSRFSDRDYGRRVSYRVTVRMDDGSVRTIYQSALTRFSAGDKVKLMNDVLVARD